MCAVERGDCRRLAHLGLLSSWAVDFLRRSPQRGIRSMREPRRRERAPLSAPIADPTCATALPPCARSWSPGCTRSPACSKARDGSCGHDLQGDPFPATVEGGLWPGNNHRSKSRGLAPVRYEFRLQNSSKVHGRSVEWLLGVAERARWRYWRVRFCMAQNQSTVQCSSARTVTIEWMGGRVWPVHCGSWIAMQTPLRRD